MILAIDGYEANEGTRVGIGRYALELLRGLEALNASSSIFSEIRVYLPTPANGHMPKESSLWKYHVVPFKKLWTFIGLPVGLMFDSPRADVVFSPTHYVPRFTGIPKVMAIMDLSYLSYPELFRTEDLHKLVNWTEYSAHHAARIITISEFSKHAIMSAYNVPENHVVVAYPALSNAILRRDMGTRPAVTHVPKRYILAVGTLQPRKNFTRLIEAFSTLADKEISLVIVGKKGWLYEEILAAPKTWNVEDRVRFLDYVSDDELPALYEKSECFVLPSLYEGFGLPVLEAMAHGVPVVVSKTSSLPEIAGEAGIYVDPEDVRSIASGLMTALAERGADRKKRITLGKKRAHGFTWENAARQVMSVLSEVGTKGSV